MPKVTVVHDVDAERLERMVPPEYRARVRALGAADGTYAILLFPHDRRDVITSAAVRKALPRVTADEALLAVGANFTVEAIELLGAHHALVASLGEFYWTDESYTSLPR